MSALRRDGRRRNRRAALPKADLDRVPPDERFFYVMAGHLANEVNILGKLLIIGGRSQFIFGRRSGFSKCDEYDCRLGRLRRGINP